MRCFPAACCALLVVFAPAAASAQQEQEPAVPLLQRRLVAHWAFIAKGDANKDGKMDPAEQAAWNEKRFASLAVQAKRETLEKFDADQNGKLSLEECWQSHLLFTAPEVNASIRFWNADANKDNTVSEEERQQLQAKVEKARQQLLQREFFRTRLQFDADKDGKLRGGERVKALEFDVDNKLRWMDRNQREDRHGEDTNWDGILTDAQREELIAFIGNHQFALAKSDRNEDGVVSQAEEEATILPWPVRRALALPGAEPLMVDLLDAGPDSVKVWVKERRNVAFKPGEERGGEEIIPLHRLSADEQKYIAHWMALAGEIHPFRAVEFPAADGLAVTADFYDTGDRAQPLLIYCHGDGSSRAEYRLIATVLAKKGYNGLAVDLRTGDSFGGVPNETDRRADARFLRERGIPLTSLHQPSVAKRDLRAALAWAKAEGFAGRIIMVTSGFNAILAVQLAAEQQEFEGLLAFNPPQVVEDQSSLGAFARQRPEVTAAKLFTHPVFIIRPYGTSASLLHLLASEKKMSRMSRKFLPGSQTLVKTDGDTRADIWKAVDEFLALARKPADSSPNEGSTPLKEKEMPSSQESSPPGEENKSMKKEGITPEDEKRLPKKRKYRRSRGREMKKGAQPPEAMSSVTVQLPGASPFQCLKR